MKEHPNVGEGLEPLRTEAIIEVSYEKKDEGDPGEVEIVRLKLGNSGLMLVFSNRPLISQDNNSNLWGMHFMPEFIVRPIFENRLRYSRMFSSGFISMVHTLTSGEVDIHPSLSKVINQ